MASPKKRNLTFLLTFNSNNPLWDLKRVKDSDGKVIDPDDYIIRRMLPLIRLGTKEITINGDPDYNAHYTLIRFQGKIGEGTDLEITYAETKT